MKRTIKLMTALLLLVTLIASSLVLTSCSEEPVQIEGAKVVGGELIFLMSDGTEYNAGALPENDENLTLTKATITNMGILQLGLSNDKNVSCGVIPTFSTDLTFSSATFGEGGKLTFTTSESTIELGRLFADTVTVEIVFRTYGTVTLELDPVAAPITVANFVKLAEEGFYDGLTIHRIQDDFMIQGGCTKGDGTGGSDTKIKGEFSANGHANDLSHTRGVISMARSADKNSASSQFFICDADSTFLDGQYAAFGYVTEGMDIIDRIISENEQYATGSMGVIPVKTNQPVIETIRVVND